MAMGIHSGLRMDPTIADSQAGFPIVRPRRLRRTATLRRMVRETRISADQLILPMFAIGGAGREEPIVSMPGHARMSPDVLAVRAARAYEAGVPAVLLFGVTDQKDDVGSQSCNPSGEVQEAVAAIKLLVPEMVVVTDVCLCEYTSHGHCGVLRDGDVDNDATLELLGRDVCVSDARHCG